MSILRIIAGAAAGAIAGGVLGYLGRCKSGMCPLTSNPYIGAVFGALLGGLIVASIWK